MLSILRNIHNNKFDGSKNRLILFSEVDVRGRPTRPTEIYLAPWHGVHAWRLGHLQWPAGQIAIWPYKAIAIQLRSQDASLKALLLTGSQ